MNPAALLADPNAWAALLSLSVLEIVLGIDNLVFISLLTSGLEEQKARHARRIGWRSHSSFASSCSPPLPGL
jgi:predicted tellurium resistance membrane protein TerC